MVRLHEICSLTPRSMNFLHPFAFRLLTLSQISLGFQTASAQSDLSRPIVSPELIFEEANGFIAVEAEHFFKQEKTDVRAWYRTTVDQSPNLKPDADPPHAAGAGGGAYLEALPDTRRNHGEKLIHGQNFSNEPGRLGILSYRVHFNTPGKYYVWARTHSTGTEDNGLHVGLNGTWPASGQRMQWTAKNRWAWGSKQRTANVHTGVPGQLFLQIDKAGPQTIQFSMREDGFEFDAWIMTTDRDFKPPAGVAPRSKVKVGKLPPGYKRVSGPKQADNFSTAPPTQPGTSTTGTFGPRGQDGPGDVERSGEIKRWHKVTLTFAGPFAHEKDTDPNPFTDYRLDVSFEHIESGNRLFVPGYFAANGNAGESSAASGNKWRVHFAPDRPGAWRWQVDFRQARHVALNRQSPGKPWAPLHGKTGMLNVGPTDKTGRDLRGKGRLDYVGRHHLRHAGSGEYFLKAGADAPETFLAYADFDGTVAGKPSRSKLKTWQPHVRDWRPGDPSWKGGKGKGMIGAINYLSGKGCNVFSFLPYNAGGDGDNVWPFVERHAKFHYDCSKLDQWGLVFDHATRMGMYLHFKLQETEMDDNNRGGHRGATKGKVPTALDGGDLGSERRLYLRELIARFGHNLALNWNLGEENTQSTRQQREMAQYIADTDPYDHLIVVHTYPNQQDKVYKPLLGDQSVLRGASLQNSNVADCHQQTVKWTQASAAAGQPWVISFDEPGTAGEGMPPDPDYPGTPKNFSNPSIHQVRKQALWGTLLAGGGGVEYYFGYKLPQNDLVCEDWRSRDQSWDYCRIALDFFRTEKIPFWEMQCADAKVGNPRHGNEAYCFAKAGLVYLVYLPDGGTRALDLNDQSGAFKLQWFNPRTGGVPSKAKPVAAGQRLVLNAPDTNDWLAVLRR